MFLLKEFNILSEKRVSFYIPSYGLPIYTDFGPVNQNAVRANESFVTIKTIGEEDEMGLDSYWANHIDSYRFGDSSSINIFD